MCVCVCVCYIYIYIYTDASITITSHFWKPAQVFSINAKGFGSEGKVLCWRDIDRFREKVRSDFSGNRI